MAAMTPHRARNDRSGWAARARGLAAAALAALLLAPAAAQRLPSYLPAETFLAVGAVDLRAHDDRLDDFVAEWERLDLTGRLLAALGGLDAASLGVPGTPGDAGDADLAAGLEDLDPMGLLGTEAWLAVSLSPFNPLPVLSFVAVVDDATAARLDDLLDDAAEEPGALRLSEGAARMVVVPGDGPFGVALARHADLFAFATNPDTLRGILRQAQGSPDPALDDRQSYAATIGTLPTGNLYGFLDVAAVADALAPFGSGLGFDVSVERVASMLHAFGAMGSVTHVTDTGLEGRSVQTLRGDARDVALFTLLTTDRPAPRELLAAVPATAHSVQVSTVHPRAIWDYVGDLVAGLRELGVTDLDRTVRDLTGVDLRADLFAWTGRGTLVMTTGFGEVVEPGVPADDLLGESVFVLVAEDEAAARAGLGRLLGNVGATVSAFADPLARGGPPPRTEATVDGVAVTTFDLFPGASVTYAVHGGLALIGTTAAGVEDAVRALGQGGALAPTLERLLAEVPADAVSFTLSDDAAALEGTAAGLAAQVQLLAGLGGAATLDFDAATSAAEALEEFLMFVASRLGGSVGWSTVDGSTIHGRERSEIDWR